MNKKEQREKKLSKSWRKTSLCNCLIVLLDLFLRLHLFHFQKKKNTKLKCQFYRLHGKFSHENLTKWSSTAAGYEICLKKTLFILFRFSFCNGYKI